MFRKIKDILTSIGIYDSNGEKIKINLYIIYIKDIFMYVIEKNEKYKTITINYYIYLLSYYEVMLDKADINLDITSIVGIAFF